MTAQLCARPWYVQCPLNWGGHCRKVEGPEFVPIHFNLFPAPPVGHFPEMIDWLALSEKYRISSTTKRQMKNRTENESD